ncbi:glycosyltransferase family 2 protein [Nocardioides daeguensis]|uniref:Glycosyltransferase family 2 protein n=1 Tax=Nocardioides daeguensis TaxID=908359 RepID=A0ABP6VXR1_9ACTN|nr:glycosyltransferase family 2 protein [Nocardioides daeguensis]MBV6728400.1 glycosyltransferase family 2 protein [Nocardioides daeguensis]MCR1773824.1 glycosyltransferase family 2 protein [Nocardioides daeguensis]
MKWRGRRETDAAPGPGPAATDRPSGDGLPRVAAITMSRDSGPVLRRWVEHYQRQLGADDVFVIDDHSVDGSADDLPCTVLRLPYLDKYPFEPSRMGILSGLAKSLLFAYDAVLLADADEFVVADPAKHASLRHFAAARTGTDVAGVLGYNVIHRVGVEPELDFDAPSLLRQREFARFTPLMCKPALKWVDADWAHASHGIRHPFEPDPELFMFHFKFADLGQLELLAEHRHQAAVVEGRAVKSSWSRPTDEIVEALRTAAAQVEQAVAQGELGRFRPGPKRIQSIVQNEGDLWRATGAGQHHALVRPPYVRIPDELRDLV